MCLLKCLTCKLPPQRVLPPAVYESVYFPIPLQHNVVLNIFIFTKLKVEKKTYFAVIFVILVCIFLVMKFRLIAIYVSFSGSNLFLFFAQFYIGLLGFFLINL